jgi:hypothetical protein
MTRMHIRIGEVRSEGERTNEEGNCEEWKIRKWNKVKKKKSKANPVTGREGPWRCEMSRLSHFLDNRLTDNGEVVSLTLRPPFTPKENSWYSFLLEAESTPGLCAARKIRSIEKSNGVIGNRTRDLPTCSIVPKPTTLPRVPRERDK